MTGFLGSLAVAAIAAVLVANTIAAAIGRFGFPLPPSERRLGCIDGLRGYLALSVMIYHFFLWSNIRCFGGSWQIPSIHMINQMGSGGVALFFMTTGLVFYPRVLAGLRATPWLTVYISRIFRIIPLVVCSVAAVTLIIVARTGARFDLDYVRAATHWIGATDERPMLGYPDSGRINAYVLWSLHYEWLFYLLVMPVCAVVMDVLRSRHFPTWYLPVTLLALSIIARITTDHLVFSVSFVAFLPLFAIGMLAYEIQSNPVWRARLCKPLVGLAALAALLVAMITTEYPYDFALPVFGFFFVCVACGNSIGGILSFRSALVLGECSFGIYILHGILLDILFVEGGGLIGHLVPTALPVVLPVLSAAVVLTTAATYLLIERPAMQSGRRLSRWLSQQHIKLDSRELKVAP